MHIVTIPVYRDVGGKYSPFPRAGARHVGYIGGPEQELRFFGAKDGINWTKFIGATPEEALEKAPMGYRNL